MSNERICQRRKFPKPTDLFTSAHKYLCSFWFNLLVADCSHTLLTPLPLTSLSKIPPKATKALPWQTLAGLPRGTKAFWLCLDMPILTKTVWIKSHQDFTACTSGVLQPATRFMAVLLPFLLLQQSHSAASPRNCSKDQDSSNAGVARDGCNSTALSHLHPEHVNYPSRLTTSCCASSLVSATAFTSQIYLSEAVLDWGGGEKSPC